MKYLNLGCGTHFSPEWTNIDFVSQSKHVIPYDLTKGIPFPDYHFNVVYHSHVLEHIPKPEVDFFMNECFRVLKKGGIIRLVVPDLEMLTTVYLETLQKAISGDDDSSLNYDWIMLHLYDQSVRSKSGGGMREYLSKDNIKNLTFVENLMGSEVKNIINSIQRTKTEKVRNTLRNEGFLYTLRLVIRSVFATNPIKEILLKILLQKEYETLQIGRFRQSGEVHQWMFDRYSLARLMGKSGFKQINQCSARQSRIPDWPEFFLDIESNGEIYRPDSIYMEGVKP